MLKKSNPWVNVNEMNPSQKIDFILYFKIKIKKLGKQKQLWTCLNNTFKVEKNTHFNSYSFRISHACVNFFIILYPFVFLITLKMFKQYLSFKFEKTKVFPYFISKFLMHMSDFFFFFVFFFSFFSINFGFLNFYCNVNFLLL